MCPRMYHATSFVPAFMRTYELEPWKRVISFANAVWRESGPSHRKFELNSDFG